MKGAERPRPMRMRLGRLAVALGLAGILLALPVATVLACTCGFAGYADAIAGADAAFIGTVISTDEPAPGEVADPFSEATYVFDVTVAKGPMADPFAVVSIFGAGANCGFDMAVGEEWLVIASVDRGQPRTGLCHGSMPTEALDAETRAIVAEAMVVPGGSPEAAPSTDAAPIASHSAVESRRPEVLSSADRAASTGLLWVGAAGVATIAAIGGFLIMHRSRRTDAT